MCVTMRVCYVIQCVVVCVGPSNATRVGSQELEGQRTRSTVSLQDFRRVSDT